nr:unnamed protein product [Spirometra erinaceieuropaei]
MKEYGTRAMEVTDGTPKVLFSYINSRLKNKETVSGLKGESNEYVTENDDKAGHVRRFLASVSTDKTNFDQTELPNRTDNTIIKSVDFIEKGVKKSTLVLMERKSTGPNHVPVKFLKEQSCKLARPLSHISQSSFDRGILLSD